MTSQTTILWILGVWLLATNVLLIWLIYYFKRLTKGIKQPNFKKVLDNIILKERENGKEILILQKELERLTEEVSFHIQKIGLIRFNPFKETGGDHSFSLALLDAKETGFILTGLHTRDSTRFYLKPVKNGKSKYKLAAEEIKAIEEARK